MSARMRSFSASYCFRVSGSDITFDTDVQINLFLREAIWDLAVDTRGGAGEDR